MYAWALWLEAALRADPFVAERLVVVKGWQTRGRPADQFSFLPSGVLPHHTACMCRDGHDPQNCLNTIVNGREGAPGPISQLLGTFTPFGVRWNGSNPDPRIALLAAGRSNHAGTGVYRWGAPPGNGSSIGIEWCGPPANGWPDVVVELYERVIAAILKDRGWSVNQVTTHNEYARPFGRKIDPSGAHAAEPHLKQLTPWNPDALRVRVQRRLDTSIGSLEAPTMSALEAPVRLMDTRPLPGDFLPAGSVVPVAAAAGRPEWANSVVVNITATNVTGNGFVTAWDDGPMPETSNLPLHAGEVTANLALVPLDAAGKFQVSNQAAGCDLVIDQQGWAG
jgi:hypothetical protein